MHYDPIPPAVDIKVLKSLAPPPEVNVSQCAEQNLVLRKGTSSRPGPWRTESYQREILECLTDSRVRVVVFRKSTLYEWVKKGLLTPPVKRVGKSPGWPVYEIERFNCARIAGWTEDEIKGNLRKPRTLRYAPSAKCSFT